MSHRALMLIQQIPKGFCEAYYNNLKYGITKTVFNSGNSFKIYGEELGGNDFISLNYYITTEKNILKPCEMSIQKVMHFLENLEIASS